MTQVVILGSGYTGRRVAERLRRRGYRVLTTAREAGATLRLEVSELETIDALGEALEAGARVLYSIPPLRRSAGWQPSAPLLRPALERAAGRVVYLSSTGVYGAVEEVDEHTPPAPRTARERVRQEEEQTLRAGPWSTLILRPAAIYGPGRGIHRAMRRGEHRLWGDGSNYVSRIHVDDLAAVAEAALLSELTGAYPVADEEPCQALEIARFCADLLGLPMPQATGHLAEEDTRRVNRRVDGSAILRLLGIRLRYPSYRAGIPASLAAES